MRAPITVIIPTLDAAETLPACLTALVEGLEANRDRISETVERHAHNDILAGVDLAGAGDDVALALLELSHRETAPRWSGKRARCDTAKRSTRGLRRITTFSWHTTQISR